LARKYSGVFFSYKTTVAIHPVAKKKNNDNLEIHMLDEISNVPPQGEASGFGGSWGNTALL
jgi:hypothetical protein